jgi:hypothetical protein
MVAPLDDFQKQCRPVLHVFGENLQQIAIIVVVDQNVKLLINKSTVSCIMKPTKISWQTCKISRSSLTFTLLSFRFLRSVS